MTFSATATADAQVRIVAFRTKAQAGIVAGSALTASQRPAVRITDVEGNPVSGVTVQFTIAANGTSGTLTGGNAAATATTNANGIATVGLWTMSVTAGVTATAVASVTDLAEKVSFPVNTTFGQSTVAAGSLNVAQSGTTTITVTLKDSNDDVTPET